ncbi:octaprenyl-diphosphate synthase [Candidatus Magnetomoraceae bacterium gMMP-15]
MKKTLKQKILFRTANDLRTIEKALSKNLNPYLDLVFQIARHIIFSGGKRLRPLLMILCARLCGYQGNFDKILSTVFEYLHAATLLHDDVVDDADMRRGKQAAHLLWDNSSVILTGDFLLARALSIAADAKSISIMKIIADVTSAMSQGEINQMMNKRNLKLSEKEYMQVIHAKTAVLIQAACQCGAILANACDEKQQALADYGFNLGLAFQMADDLLDYVADTKILGKSTGADLREGKLTMPVIYTLERADKKDRAKMHEIISDEKFSFLDFENLLSLLKKYGGIKYTQKKAVDFVNTAKKSLSVFDESQTKDTLLKIADYVVARKE